MARGVVHVHPRKGFDRYDLHCNENKDDRRTKPMNMESFRWAAQALPSILYNSLRFLQDFFYSSSPTCLDFPFVSSSENYTFFTLILAVFKAGPIFTKEISI